MKPIYKIICYDIDSAKLTLGQVSFSDFTRDREWGFYYDFNKALKCIKENWTDIYENGYYNLVCIEETYEGIVSSHQTKRYWFKVDYINQNTYNVEFLNYCFFTRDYAYSFQTNLPVP